jgi:hypothetical protein
MVHHAGKGPPGLFALPPAMLIFLVHCRVHFLRPRKEASDQASTLQRIFNCTEVQKKRANRVPGSCAGRSQPRLVPLGKEERSLATSRSRGTTRDRETARDFARDDNAG